MHLPSWLKSTWRVLRWLLLAALLLALTLIAALWWANRHDDPLRPEVAALLKGGLADRLRGMGRSDIIDEE